MTKISNIQLTNSGPVTLYIGTFVRGLPDYTPEQNLTNAVNEGETWSFAAKSIPFPIGLRDGHVFDIGVWIGGNPQPHTYDNANTWTYDSTSQSTASYEWQGTGFDGKLVYSSTIVTSADIGQICLKNSGPVLLYPKFCQNSGGPLVWNSWGESQWEVAEGGQCIIGPDQRQGWPATSGEVNLGVVIRGSNLDPQDTAHGWNLQSIFTQTATYEWTGGVGSGSLTLKSVG